ncbi:MAG: FAD-dependent oxidoreductase [Geminicoccaceae bacterium]
MSNAGTSERPKTDASARVVVVGGGVIGCSAAYHLAERGWQDIIVLERRTLGCGTTWHSHGLIGLIRSSPNMTRLALHTNKVLRQLEAETGLSTGFKQNGSLILATSEAHLLQLRQVVSMMKPTGLELHEISVTEAKRLWPLASMEDVISVFSMPAEGQVNPLDTLQAYARAARMRGVKIYEQTPVISIESDKGRVTGVRTGDGLIRAEKVVIASGLWSWELGRASNIDIPLMAVEQSYMVTEPIDDIVPGLPILRDFECGLLAREDARQLAIGATAFPEKPWGYDGIPGDFEFDELDGEPDRFEQMFAHLLHRIPAMADIGIRKFLTGPESVAPDSRYLLGEPPGFGGCIVATGMSGVGIGSSGGIGREIACWLDEGSPGLDMWDCDIRRTMAFEVNKRYLFDKVTETGGALFAILSPEYQPKAARNVRHSPVHDRMAAVGAVFEVMAGWEVPSCFVVREAQRDISRHEMFSSMLDEQRSLEDGASFSDLSSHTNLIVKGRDAGATLARLAAGPLPEEVGRHRLVPFLNGLGRIEFVADIIRLGDQHFHVLADALQQTRALNLLEAGLEGDHASLFDASSGFAIFSLAGGAAGSLLRSVGVRELPGPGESAVCDFGYSRSIVIGFPESPFATWQVLVPTEFAQCVYDQLVQAEAVAPLTFLGRNARLGLMIEAGAPHREMKIDPMLSINANGLAGCVNWETSIEFAGKHAAAAMEEQCGRLPVTLALRSSGPRLFGYEPIWSGDRMVGHILRAGYSASRNAAVGFGAVVASAREGNLSIEVAMEQFPADIIFG